MPKDTFYNLSNDKQEKVMRAAITEFLARGFENGKIGDIASLAGIAKGSIYQYFEDKKELFLHSVHWSSEYLLQKYSAAASGTLKKASFVEVFLHSLDHAWIQLKEEKEITLFLQEVLLGTFNPVAAESREAMLKASDSFIHALIKEGQESGQFRTDLDEELLVQFLTGASMRFKEKFLQKVKASGSELSDVLAEEYKREAGQLYELILNGMGAR